MTDDMRLAAIDAFVACRYMKAASLQYEPFALSLSKGRSFFATVKRRTVLRQAQHERIWRWLRFRDRRSNLNARDDLAERIEARIDRLATLNRVTADHIKRACHRWR